MKKLTYLILVFAALTVVGCKKYRVEFNEDATPQVEFKPTAITLTRGTATTPATATILVQLVGKQQASDISVPYTIDATNTTAVAGTHYTSSTNGTVVIPANSSSGKIVLTSNYANMTAAKKLVLILSSGGAVQPSPNYKTCTVTLSTTSP